MMVLIKTTIHASRIQDLETECELLWIELTLNKRKTLCGIFYRPPISSPDTIHSLHNSLNGIPASADVILCGDFNVPNVNWNTTMPTIPSPVTSSLCDMAHNFSLQQLVPEPTRQNNTLDLLLTNNTNRIEHVSVIDGTPGSDHDGICFSLVMDSTPLPRKEHRRLYNFKEANFSEMRELLIKTPCDCCFLQGGIDQSWTNFKDLFLTVADQFIPSFVLKRRRTKSWLSDEVTTLISSKRRAYRLAKRSRNHTHIHKYKSLCNTVRKLTRRDRNLHVEHITSELHQNQKPFWRWIKTIPDIHVQRTGNIITSACEKAKAFNSFFTSVFTKVINKNLKQSLLRTRNSAEIKDILINSIDVHNLLLRINPSKPSGPDNIPGRLLKEATSCIAEPLTKLFNMSLSEGRLPSDWTRANVSPVFKKGSKHLLSNYRPVSLTSLVFKTMEQLVHQTITEFLEEHKKLSPTQHGFRRALSCQTQLLETVHHWAKTLDECSLTHVIFLDFSKAFDTVPHNKLCL